MCSRLLTHSTPTENLYKLSNLSVCTLTKAKSWNAHRGSQAYEWAIAESYL